MQGKGNVLMSGEKNKPVIGITMGDPASIGPEITLKALSDRIVYEVCRPLVIGDAMRHSTL